MSQIHGTARLGKNPELKYIGEGEDKKPVCEIWLKMLNSRKNKSKDDWEDLGFWAQLNLWGNLAEPAARLLSKGDRVYVSGRIVEKTWSQSDIPSEQAEESETHSTLVIDTNFIAPYLGDLESLKYKPRKALAAGDALADAADPELAATS
jgi:single-stranded DNA-binding protein